MLPFVALSHTWAACMCTVVYSHCSDCSLAMRAVLEIVRARWGTTAHLVFMFFAFCTNILVSSMLILGGAAVVNALTGMDLYAVRHPLIHPASHPARLAKDQYLPPDASADGPLGASSGS